MVLVRRAARGPAPLIPVDLFRDPVFALSVTASICAFAAFAITFVALPFYFQSVLGRDQVATGLLMTPWPVALGLAAPIAGRLSDRVAAGVLGAAGMAGLALGLAFLSRTIAGIDRARHRADDGPLRLRLRLLSGAEQPHHAGGGAARPSRRRRRMLATARLLGMTLGATVVALVFQVAPERAEHASLLIGAVFAIAAGTTSVLRLSRRTPAEAVRRT